MGREPGENKMTDIQKFRETLNSKGSIVEIEKFWPQHGEQFIKAFITYQRMQDSKAKTLIKDCSQESLYDCLKTAAQMQLMPSKFLNYVHFIPFNNSKTGTPDCALIVGYQGMIDILLRDDKIRKIESFLVREGEIFEVTAGTTPGIKHIINPTSTGEVIAGYAVATLTHGETQFTVMSRKEIDKIRDDAQRGQYVSTFWKNHYNPMAKKTLIRRLFNYLPKPKPNAPHADAYEKALEVDNKEYEGNTIETEYKVGTPDELLEIIESEDKE